MLKKRSDKKKGMERREMYTEKREKKKLRVYNRLCGGSLCNVLLQILPSFFFFVPPAERPSVLRLLMAHPRAPNCFACYVEWGLRFRATKLTVAHIACQVQAPRRFKSKRAHVQKYIERPLYVQYTMLPRNRFICYL